MRAIVAHMVPVLLSTGLVLTACITPSLNLGDDDSSSSTTATATGDAGVDAGFVGGGCGTESTTGQQLCTATTMCPTLVIDVQAMPHCGFRLRNGVPDLVCACGTSICSMGVFDTCLQAASLLTNQTESSVCSQIGDGRCLEITTTPTTTTAATSSSSSTSSGGTGCDTQCVKDCGGGEACASVCNCN